MREAAETSVARCGEATRDRRRKVVEEWEEWACDFPESVRPRLKDCRPLEVVMFLEDWQASHRGRRMRGRGTMAKEGRVGVMFACLWHLAP